MSQKFLLSQVRTWILTSISTCFSFMSVAVMNYPDNGQFGGKKLCF